MATSAEAAAGASPSETGQASDSGDQSTTSEGWSATASVGRAGPPLAASGLAARQVPIELASSEGDGGSGAGVRALVALLMANVVGFGALALWYRTRWLA